MVRSLSACTGAIAAGAALLLSLAASACSVEPLGPHADVSGGQGSASGVKAFPDGAVADWVTYGDFLLLVKVTTEKRLPPQDVEVKRGEGLIPRLVQLRTEQVGWRRPTLADGVNAPGSVTVGNAGWIFHGTEERPLGFRGQQPLEVGRSYAVVLSWADLGQTGEPEWLALRILPIVDSTVGAPPADTDFEAPEVVGLSIEDLGRTLTETEIDPVAKPYMRLDAWERRLRVMEANPGPPQVPGPGEY